MLRIAQDLKSGNYKLEKFCMEPTSFTVKEESSFKGGETEFVKTKLMTRLTYTLDAVSARGAADTRGAQPTRFRSKPPGFMSQRNLAAAPAARHSLASLQCPMAEGTLGD